MKMMKMPHSWLGMIKSKRQDIFGIARLLICHSDRSSLLQFCKYTEKKISEILLERTIDIYLSRWKGECYTYILDHCYHQFYIHAAKKLSSSARLRFAVIHWPLILCMADQKCHMHYALCIMQYNYFSLKPLGISISFIEDHCRYALTFWYLRYLFTKN